MKCQFPQTTFGLTAGDMLRDVFAASELDLAEAMDFELDNLATECDCLAPLYRKSVDPVRMLEDRVANEKARRLRSRRMVAS